jgi:cell division protein FtsI/penicillin-binding protein 2
MKLTFFIFFIFFIYISLTHFVSAQGYIDLKKEKAIQKLEKLRTENSKINTLLQITDSTVTYLVRDTSVQNLDFILYFDRNGKCFKEKLIARCDSCYQKFIKHVLSSGSYRWTKIGSTQYLSRFPYRLIFETKLDQDFAFEIRRSDIEGSVYRKMVREGLE